MTEPTIPALRPLQNVDGALTTLRGGRADAEGLRAGVQQVAAAVERSLRLLLRDEPTAPMHVRLIALDPEELRTETVLAELRQANRISIELGAAIHELFEARRRMRQGGEVAGAEAEQAGRTVARLEQEIVSRRSTPQATQIPVEPEEPTLVPEEPSRLWAGRPPGWVLAGAAVLLLVIVLAGVLLGGRGRSENLERGIALFRSGEYADAASHFYRHTQANPEDLTARLYLVRIHRRMNRPDLAGQEMREALRLAPEDPDVQREMGFLLLDTDQPDAAAQRFQRAIEIDPASAHGWAGLVRALRESGRPDAAERVLATAPAEVRALLSGAGAAR